MTPARSFRLSAFTFVALSMVSLALRAAEGPAKGEGDARPPEAAWRRVPTALPGPPSSAALSADRLVLYPAPAGMPLNHTFRVEVKSPNGLWRKLDVYDVRVDLHTLTHASFASFDFAGKVNVRVTSREPIRSAEVRPRHDGIRASVSDPHTLEFTLDQPRNLSIEINGDRSHNLHLFANPLEQDIPSPTDPNVLYFGPGLHTDQPVIRVPSGRTVYLAGGAVVRGIFITEDHASHVTFRGRGIIDMAPWNEPKGRYIHGQTWQAAAINLRWTTDARIEGLIIKQNTDYGIMGGEVRNVTIDNVKIFSSHEWSDGIDMMSSNAVTIRRCFLRTSDDCFAIYGSRRDFNGGTADWDISDCVLWSDVAHAMFIGMHGAYWANGDVIQRLTFRNIDVLESRQYIPKFYGVMAITCGDKNTVRDVTFENIRVEDIDHDRGYLVHLDFDFYNPSTTPGRRIENVTFKDISYAGPCGSSIDGNRGGSIDNVTFDHVQIGGHPVTTAAAGRIQVTGTVSGVQFR